MRTFEQLVFDFTFALARHDSSRPLRAFERRDGIATLILLGALMRLGYGYGEPLFNQPPVRRPKESDVVPLLEFELPRVRPGDLILQTTRPPIHDKDKQNMKRVERAHTDLEQRMFDLWVPRYLAHCARDQMWLSVEEGRRLRQGYENRTCMEFTQRGQLGPYASLVGGRNSGQHVPGKGRTAVFLLNQPELWKGGPDYLCCFGMTGLSTLVWAQKVAHEVPHLLTRPGFYVYELEIGPVPARPLDLGFCRDWKLEPVLEHEFGPRRSSLSA